MRRLYIVILAVLAFVLLAAATTMAVISVGSTARIANESWTEPTGAEGLSCRWQLSTDNVTQRSTHTNSANLVTNGVEVLNVPVERETGKFTSPWSSFHTAGETITLNLMLGDDPPLSSVGLTVTQECEEPPPSTSTIPPETTLTTVTTTTSPPDTIVTTSLTVPVTTLPVPSTVTTTPSSTPPSSVPVTTKPVPSTVLTSVPAIPSGVPTGEAWVVIDVTYES